MTFVFRHFPGVYEYGVTFAVPILFGITLKERLPISTRLLSNDVFVASLNLFQTGTLHPGSDLRVLCAPRPIHGYAEPSLYSS